MKSNKVFNVCIFKNLPPHWLVQPWANC